jgi:hypothetical protein
MARTMPSLRGDMSPMWQRPREVQAAIVETGS